MWETRNSPHPSLAADGTACSGAAPTGLLLFRTLDAAGQAAHPSLLLAGCDGVVRGGIDLPDPREIIATPSGCRAVVRCGTGATFVVDGVAGTALELDLGPPADDLRYEAWLGGGRWGFFNNGRSPLFRSPGGWETDARTALVDFATGEVTHLRDVLHRAFSPDGETLIVDNLGGGGHSSWSIPTNDPSQYRATGGRYPAGGSSDGRRLLYADWETFRRRKRRVLEVASVRVPVEEVAARVLILEDTPAGARTVIARVPDWTPERIPSGWFLPGRPEIAVQYPDHFALIDPGGGGPRELFSLDGWYAWFNPAPSGRRGVLEEPIGAETERAADLDPDAVSDEDLEMGTARLTDSILTWVDFERGTSRRLGDDNEPLRIETRGDDWWSPVRWMLLSAGGDAASPHALVALDTETGTTSPLLALAGTPQELGFRQASADGRTVLLERRVDGNTTRVTLLDLERGTVTEFDASGLDTMSLSRDGRWAAYATRETAAAERTATLTIVETATGTTTVVSRGFDPVWLAP